MCLQCRNAFVQISSLACWGPGLLLAFAALAHPGMRTAADDSNTATFCDCGGSSRTEEKSPSKAANVAPKRRVLRVAADPNNLPLSNDKGEGFENKLAELL